MHGIATHPTASAVGAGTRRADLGPQRALTARLDIGVGRLHQNREISCQPVRVGLREASEAIELGVDLFTFVEDVRDIPVRLREFRGQSQCDRDPALHVTGPQPVDIAPGQRVRQIARRRNGIEVSPDQHPVIAPLMGARDDGIPVAVHREVRLLCQCGRHGIGQRRLVARLAGDVHEVAGEGHHIATEIQAVREQGGHVGTVSR